MNPLDAFRDMTPIHQHIVLYTITERARELFNANPTSTPNSEWPTVCHLNYMTNISGTLSWADFVQSSIWAKLGAGDGEERRQVIQQAKGHDKYVIAFIPFAGGDLRINVE